MKNHTPSPDGYYEDDADEVAELEQETARAGLRQRVVAVLGTSYGISIGVHVAILLVLATILISSPPPEAVAELRVHSHVETPKVEERKPDIVDKPLVEAEDKLEEAIIIKNEEVEITNDIPKGTSFDNPSDKHLDDRSINDAFGVGGGPSGAYGSRFGEGRKKGGDGGDATECVVREALEWLANHQSKDGGWEAAGWTQQCKQERCTGPGWNEGSASHDVGLTGLATLAFLGNGNTHQFAKVSKFRLVVRRALRHLRDQQAEDGSIGMKGVPEQIYDHAIATMALCEAYAITRDFELKRPAERSAAFLIAAQNPGLGWRYGVRSGQNDTSVTGWVVLALKAARMANIDVPDATFEGAHAWFKRATDSAGDAGYMTPGGGSSFLGAVDGQFDPVPTNTAVAVLGRVLMGERRSEDALRRGCKLMLADRPSWSEPTKTRKVNFYYWYYGSYAMFQLGGQPWHDWNDAMKAALLPTVRQGGCADGSWDPVDAWSIAGGRVYATAINALTLEIYYRYERTKEEENGR